MINPDDSKQIYDTALRFLTRREHSQWELIQKLRHKDFDLSQIQPVIDTLIQKNLLSNERFAENYVRMRTREGFGPLKIAQELSYRQLDASLIEKHLSDYKDSWQELIQTVQEKHFGHQKPSDFKTYAKQARFLQSRGFTLEQINQLLKPKFE